MADDNNAQDGTASKKKKKSGGRMFLPLMIIFSLAAIVFIQTTYIFMMVGLLPTIVAYIVDRRPGKMAFQAVAAFNLSGMMHYLAELIFIHDNSSSSVQQMMGNSSVWFTIYSTAALGWIMIFALPYLMNAVLAGVHSGQVMRLEILQKRLEEKWGPEVTRPR